MIKTIADLIPDDTNARAHNPRNIGMIVDSLHSVGAARSIVIDEDNVILAGNGVIEAAAEAGIERVQVIDADGETIIAVRRTGLTDEQKIKLALYDNRTAELATWSAEQILADLDAGVDLSDLFYEDELADLLKDVDFGEPEEPPEPQIDRAEELREKWQTERGQIWEIPSETVAGKTHRIMCGDSTSEEDVARLMGGEKAALCVTSPPYFVGKDYEDQHTEESVLAFIAGSAGLMGNAVNPARRICINVATTAWSHINGGIVDYRLNLDWWQSALRSHGWFTRSIRVWAKHGGLVHNAPSADIVDMHWEFLATFYRKDAQYRGQNRVGEGWATSGIWDGIHGAVQTDHPAPFPTIIPGRFIRLYTDVSEVVLEPFLGSASTMVAAEQTGRLCYGMEISEAYTAVCLQRMQDMGLEPRLVEQCAN